VRPDLVLHIGTGKAGSTSIQSFLHRNRERLAERGLLYPRTPGPTRHSRLGLSMRSDEELANDPTWHHLEIADPTRFRRRFRRRLLREIDESGAPHVLFSDESLYGSSFDTIRRLHQFTDQIATGVRAVVYLRRQDDHMVSRYQQVVKAGEVRRLDEWGRQDYAKTYDYHARLSAWRDLLQPRELVVRRFERSGFVNGSLIDDFFDAAGLPVRLDDLEQVDVRNVSLGAEAVEFLRLHNLHRVENEGARARLIGNADLVRVLAAHETGPALTLPAEQLDAVMARWEDSNRAVVRDFLGGGDEPLFREHRKTSGTTTEQRLDPARLEHYLTLLELPEAVHAPLRRIAEREAVRR
jgi:hypothetical protein